MAVSVPELTKLRRELRRLRAENARLRNRHATTTHRRRKVAKLRALKWMSLIGVGKEIWQGINADAYINAERNAWN